jgi:hypothetical protein
MVWRTTRLLIKKNYCVDVMAARLLHRRRPARQGIVNCTKRKYVSVILICFGTISNSNLMAVRENDPADWLTATTSRMQHQQIAAEEADMCLQPFCFQSTPILISRHKVKGRARAGTHVGVSGSRALRKIFGLRR